MLKQKTPNKLRLLDLKFIERLKEAEDAIKGASRKSYIPFPVVFGKICRCFSIKKDEAKRVLNEYSAEGKIEIICSKGIKLINSEDD
jgi:hypothetical protein